MPQIKVTLSANAGVCIEAGGKKMWIDALYTDVGSTFSALDPVLREWVLSGDAFAPPDHICYTHCHGDHYSRELTQRATEKWPDAQVYIPQKELDRQNLLSQARHCFRDGDVLLEFFRLPHEGSQYADVPLYGLLLSVCGSNILLPGDCAVASTALADAVGNRRIDLAIVDFPWITLRRGQAFLEEYIKPRHILAYHLPFEEDDVNGYRKSAGRAVEMLKSKWNERCLWDPKQTETVNI